MADPATARRWFEKGEVRKAQVELSLYLRDHPADNTSRTFLFELLCFSGEFQRAERHLAVLAQGNAQTETGAVLYYSALHAEKTRHEMFERPELSITPAPASPSGKLNGKPFRSLRDSDPDMGSRLEVFAAGAYLWIPFQHIASVEIESPRKLRDMLWVHAFVRTGPTFQGRELGEVLIPAIYPFSWRHANGGVWLGRVTDWAADEQGREYPAGQRILLMDDEEVPFLEVRSMEFTVNEAAAPAAAS
jgi:type VI secretion system protein ImpE